MAIVRTLLCLFFAGAIAFAWPNAAHAVDAHHPDKDSASKQTQANDSKKKQTAKTKSPQKKNSGVQEGAGATRTPGQASQ